MRPSTASVTPHSHTLLPPTIARGDGQTCVHPPPQSLRTLTHYCHLRSLEVMVRHLADQSRGSNKVYSASSIKCAIASKSKALNWRAVFSSQFLMDLTLSFILRPRRNGFNPRSVHFGFSQVGIEPDDAAGRRRVGSPGRRRLYFSGDKLQILRPMNVEGKQRGGGGDLLHAFQDCENRSALPTYGASTARLSVRTGRPGTHLLCRHDGNTARRARRSDEALGARVSVARIAPSLLDFGRGGEDETDFKDTYIAVTFAIGSPFIKYAPDDCEPITDLRGSYLPSPYYKTTRLPTRKANLVRLLHDFLKLESYRTMTLVSGFSRGSPVSPAPSFWRRSIFTSITLIGSQDFAVKSRPKSPHSSLMHKPGVNFVHACLHISFLCWSRVCGVESAPSSPMHSSPQLVRCHVTSCPSTSFSLSLSRLPSPCTLRRRPSSSLLLLTIPDYRTSVRWLPRKAHYSPAAGTLVHNLLYISGCAEDGYYQKDSYSSSQVSRVLRQGRERRDCDSGRITCQSSPCRRVTVQLAGLPGGEEDRGEQGSIPGGFAPEFSHIVIVPDDAAGRRVFLGISRFPRSCISALLHTHLAPAPSADVKDRPNFEQLLWAALNIEVLRASEVSTERCRNPRENAPSSGIVQHNFPVRRCPAQYPCTALSSTISLYGIVQHNIPVRHCPAQYPCTALSSTISLYGIVQHNIPVRHCPAQYPCTALSSTISLYGIVQHNIPVRHCPAQYPCTALSSTISLYGIVQHNFPVRRCPAQYPCTALSSTISLYGTALS
ncbi:hypothetical protein PR048_029658 [Dryococelus australis]|uniref:Uncharacterized protein n=1 Tax=Dryococelus australis TaxID=614101 RepID=A0ABQ9GE08_9NEOP|nr:hypothetical protein PR048_029658 [Dryococelus australis]